MKEIERKFLVDPEKWSKIKKPQAIHIVQGYLHRSDQLVTRIRIKDNKAFMAVKSSNIGITRLEFEYEIPLIDAQEMLEQFCPKKIEKHRFEIPFGDYIWEVDEFISPNNGLILAEIELPDEKSIFQSPNWLSLEVSENPNYFNSNML